MKIEYSNKVKVPENCKCIRVLGGLQTTKWADSYKPWELICWSVILPCDACGLDSTQILTWTYLQVHFTVRTLSWHQRATDWHHTCRPLDRGQNSTKWASLRKALGIVSDSCQHGSGARKQGFLFDHILTANLRHASQITPEPRV